MDKCHERFQSDIDFMLKRISAFLSARGNVVPAPAEIAQGFFDEPQAEQEGSYVANPQVVHGNVSREGKGFFQYVAFEGHAAPEVAILYQQVVELTEMCLVTLEKRWIRYLERRVRNRAVAYDTIGICQRLAHFFYFMGKPAIVLVREIDDVAVSAAQGMFKVVDWRPGGRALGDFDSAVIERTHDV